MTNRQRASSGGFTLVELMIVVAIVAVLALLGMVGYQQIMNSSHAAEARHMLGAIRLAQEGRKAETGSYANVSPGYAPLCPAGAGGAVKVGWNQACGQWSQLPVKSDGPVRYAYATIAGRSGIAVTAVPGQGADFPQLVWPPAPAADWFVAYAQLNEDGDAVFSRGVASSFTNEIFVVNEGE
ncbi:MAG TPA: prepilin-type N-terminal cleavage/methylation domain-containing protein [Polyangiaceae bacterium]|jgi:prepilin-type N-terminal cleavage/methylation domain-containing protein|nr:prepilin-type N-terminal cleavage/methylation domain-containing protein [Polyangiaceae bacterium]